VAKLTPIPYKEIAAQALRCAETLLERWLPGGKYTGSAKQEYLVSNPLRSDKKPSLSINLINGHGSDFGAGEPFVDLIALYAYLEGIQMPEAAMEVADQIGFILPEGCRRDSGTQRERKAQIVDPAAIKEAKPKEPPEWEPMFAAPANAEAPPVAHIKRGKPQTVYPYKGPKGERLGFVYRFVTSDGGKETLPLVWAKSRKTGKAEWRWMQWKAGERPLYGLDRLAANPEAWVLLVEGEKCADAPLKLLTKCAIVTWSGGTGAIDKVDFSPLAGRNIIAWPDCDGQREPTSKKEVEQGVDPDSKPLLPEIEQPGVKAMLAIKEKLIELDPETKFRIVDLPAPGSVESGWDIADAIAEGWELERLRDFILKTRDYTPAPENTQTDTSASASSSASLPKKSKSKSTAKPANAEGSGDWSDHLRYEKGKIADTRENVFAFLNYHPDLAGVVAFDKFSLRIIKRRAAPWDMHHDESIVEWGDGDNLELSLWLSTYHGFTVRSVDTINQAVKLMASRNAFDPLTDWLSSLEWDGTSRIDEWLTKYCGIRAGKYTTLVGRYFLISMIARAFKPGCIMRAMPVFEGVQLRGKSSIARILAGKWFSDSPLDLRGKDGFINIQGTWLHEIAELGSFNNQEAPIIKAYLSSAIDRYRSPFDKYARDWPRRTVFFGTTNEDTYLRDKTGNSRFWPLKTEEVSDIDLEGLAAAREQLFAEALMCFERGDRYHPTAEEQTGLFAPEQNLREYDDPWESRISEWLWSETFARVSVASVLSDCLKIEPGKQTQANAIQVGKIMNRLGWKQSRPDDKENPSKKRIRYYNRPDDWVQVAGKAPAVKIELKGDWTEEDEIPF
jgi:predicted P-loop ATPase